MKTLKNILFESYYYKFLNYDGNNIFVKSINRDLTVNEYFYPVIIAFYKKNIIYSISNEYYDELTKYIMKENKNSKIDEILYNFFKMKNFKFSILRMKRMAKFKNNKIDFSEVVALSKDMKKQYFNSFESHNSNFYKEDKWKKIQTRKYLYLILKNDTFASLGFVSNIIENGANIVVQTREKYRNNGYAKKIVEKISRELIKDEIIPIYWVNINNPSSIKVATSLGFSEYSEELVVRID